MHAPPTSRDALRVVVVDDHDLFRTGLGILLGEFGLDVVGTTSSGEAGVRLVRELRPDAVLMDLNLPRISGAEATRQIVADHPDAVVVVLSASAEHDDVVDCLLAGASGYLVKDAQPGEIAAAVKAAASGGVPFSPPVAQRLLQRIRESAEHDTPAETLPELSPREGEVLRLVAAGWDNAAVARELHLSPSTVKNLVSSILDKLGAANRVQAAVLAARAGFL